MIRSLRSLTLISLTLVLLVLPGKLLRAQTPTLPNETPDKIQPTNYGFDYVRRDVKPVIRRLNLVRRFGSVKVGLGSKELPGRNRSTSVTEIENYNYNFLSFVCGASRNSVRSTPQVKECKRTLLLVSDLV